MKCIVKGQEPKAFTEWKALANDNWQPSYNNLGGEPKKAVKHALMEEQGYICCYCERWLTYEDSHIEHFIPQCDQTIDPLDYTNMLCSCQNRLTKGAPRHCGSLKDNWCDQVLLISPFTAGCETVFEFFGNGEIRPKSAENLAADATIRNLGLNIGKLNALRKATIEPFLSPDVTNEEFRTFVTAYLNGSGNGQHGEFWNAIQYLFGEYVTA